MVHVAAGVGVEAHGDLDLGPGAELTLLNTATASFDGSPFPAAQAENAADPVGFLPYPQVMRFRVAAGPATRRPIPAALATDYSPPTVEALAGAPRRAIALVEREIEGEPNMLTMRELSVVDEDDSGPIVTVIDGEATIRYRSVAAHFEDATTLFPMLEQYEVWQLINQTGDTHPIHLHLDPFQIVSRRAMRYEIPDGGIQDRDLASDAYIGPVTALSARLYRP